MRDEIGVPVRARMEGLKPIEVMVRVDSDCRVLASEGRIADDRIETGFVAIEDLREFERP